MNYIRVIYSALSIILFQSCLEPYEADIPDSALNFLVVESDMNASKSEGLIKLSRVLSINNERRSLYETNASVSIRTKNGGNFNLTEGEDGQYYSNNINLGDNDSSQLVILTADDSEYRSEFVPIKKTPEIDSIYWQVDDDGLHIFLNSTDPLNNTTYYRWNYVETVNFKSSFNSTVMWDPNLQTVVSRPQKDRIHVCWANDLSKSILLGSSANLDNDIINRQHLLSIPPYSWKHSIKYSVLVSQYGLTRDEYDYWLNLQESTENAGSIFDTQPSNLKGNIKSVNNPNEPVVGYFGISAASEKRVFIDRLDLPRAWRPINTNSCNQESATLLSRQEFNANPEDRLLIYPVYEGPVLLGYLTDHDRCIDCRLVQKEATLTKPDFWE